ncbi:MAG: 16S rRNA (cytidine(1402)-2'-O)-methyltransferase [Thermoanaerobaculaceae bacterium]
MTPGVLFVVATPIGSLGDLSPRAREVLTGVSAILAEDTRRTLKLLSAHGIKTRVVAFHAHNESQLSPRFLAELREGRSLALVADAGTPLLCDPGYRLVRSCRQEGLPVLAVPGPSAVTAALSVAGLPPYPFTFLGFLPPKKKQRQDFLAAFACLPHTLVIFLSPHRLSSELAACREILGAQREAALLAELSKLHERCLWGRLGNLSVDELTLKGEFTLVVGPPEEEPRQRAILAQKARELVGALEAQGLPLAQARKRACEVLGIRRRELYQLLETAKREA